MSDQRPTVIVNQRQTNNGCCAGCSTLFVMALVVGIAAALWEVMSGGSGLAWAVVAWAGVIVVSLIVLLGALVAAEEYFGWGIFEDGVPDSHRDTIAAEDIAASSNYGPPTDASSATARRLNELRALYDEGHITDEEYQRRRARILDDI